jgi:hypothetical protein
VSEELGKAGILKGCALGLCNLENFWYKDISNDKTKRMLHFPKKSYNYMCRYKKLQVKAN